VLTEVVEDEALGLVFIFVIDVFVITIVDENCPFSGFSEIIGEEEDEALFVFPSSEFGATFWSVAGCC
jgi:hypothetical protein